MHPLEAARPHKDAFAVDQVEYRDGDKEALHIPMERVRLLMHAGEMLEAPSVEHLRIAANHLVVAASTAKAGTRATTSETAGAIPSAPSHLQLQPGCT